MNLSDALTLFGLFIIFLGLGLLLYVSLVGLLLRFHIILFPKIYSKLVALTQHNQEENAK